VNSWLEKDVGWEESKAARRIFSKLFYDDDETTFLELFFGMEREKEMIGSVCFLER